MSNDGITIDAKHDKWRLDKFLTQRYKRISRSQWQKRITQGHVLINGLSSRSSRVLNYKDVITFLYDKPDEPETAQHYGIIYEDEYILVIDKPANLPVHPSGPYLKNTLYTLLKNDKGNDFAVHFVNRIDRETSGIVLLAKDKVSLKGLLDQFKGGTVRKEYLVAVQGAVHNYVNAQGFIGNAGGVVKKMRKFQFTQVDVSSGQWQPCRTEFFSLYSSPHVSALRAVLHTGRMHQIRATLKSLGHPVLGDTLYGVNPEFYLKFIQGKLTAQDRQALGAPRTALHSWKLSFVHPITGIVMALTAPVPLDVDFFEAIGRDCAADASF